MATYNDLLKLPEDELTNLAFDCIPEIDIDLSVNHGWMPGRPRKNRDGTDQYSIKERVQYLEDNLTYALEGFRVDIRSLWDKGVFDISQRGYKEAGALKRKAVEKICVELEYCKRMNAIQEDVAYMAAVCEALVSFIGLPGATTLAVWAVKRRLLDKWCDCAS